MPAPRSTSQDMNPKPALFLNRNLNWIPDPDPFMNQNLTLFFFFFQIKTPLNHRIKYPFTTLHICYLEFITTISSPPQPTHPIQQVKDKPLKRSNHKSQCVPQKECQKTDISIQGQLKRLVACSSGSYRHFYQQQYSKSIILNRFIFKAPPSLSLGQESQIILVQLFRALQVTYSMQDCPSQTKPNPSGAVNFKCTGQLKSLSAIIELINKILNTSITP